MHHAWRHSRLRAGHSNRHQAPRRHWGLVGVSSVSWTAAYYYYYYFFRCGGHVVRRDGRVVVRREWVVVGHDRRLVAGHVQGNVAGRVVGHSVGAAFAGPDSSPGWQRGDIFLLGLEGLGMVDGSVAID